MIPLKRAYEPASPADGSRFLVERLWPRGVKKDDLHLRAWLKDVAPSTELRRWFSHDPAKWSEFRRRYFAELDADPDALEPLLEAARHNPRVTFVYSSHDEQHNNAVALKEYVETELAGSHARPKHASSTVSPTTRSAAPRSARSRPRARQE